VPPEKLELGSKKAEGALQNLSRFGAAALSWYRVKGVDDAGALRALLSSPAGEHIIGFITRGRGVTVHTIGCPTVLESDPHRGLKLGGRNNQTPRP
jgi:GTP pyrophosphokinase